MKYLDRAIDLALENVKENGTPYGAVVVKDGIEIVGEGVNEMHYRHDISAHAELSAIKKAQENLGRIDLSDCVVYASGHPCPMCLGAIALSNIETVYYVNAYDETSQTSKIYQYLGGNQQSINLKLIHKPSQSSDRDPMKVYKNTRD